MNFCQTPPPPPPPPIIKICEWGPWALNRTDFFFNIYLGTAIISCDRWMLLLLLYWKNIKLMFVVMNNYNCYCVGSAVVTWVCTSECVSQSCEFKLCPYV